MNILLIILLVLAALMVILLIVAFFIPDEYIIEREIIIKQPPRKVWDYIKHLKNQDYYNKWVIIESPRFGNTL